MESKERHIYNISLSIGSLGYKRYITKTNNIFNCISK